MFRTTLFKKVAAVTTGISANIAILYTGYKQGQINQDSYKRLSPEEQKKTYDGCPAQKYGTGLDFCSTVIERVYTANPTLHEKDRPLKPYKPHT